VIFSLLITKVSPEMRASSSVPTLTGTKRAPSCAGHVTK
jgi:hypothetical protein